MTKTQNKPKETKCICPYTPSSGNHVFDCPVGTGFDSEQPPKLSTINNTYDIPEVISTTKPSHPKTFEHILECPKCEMPTIEPDEPECICYVNHYGKLGVGIENHPDCPVHGRPLNQECKHKWAGQRCINCGKWESLNQESWEERFDDNFLVFKEDKIINGFAGDEIKAFIKDLLLRRDRELVEILEAEKRTLDEQAMEVLRHAGTPNGEGNIWNNALDKAIDLIKGEGK